MCLAKQNHFTFGTSNILLDANTLGFFKIQRFAQKKKNSNLRSKRSYLGIFRLKFEKTIFIFEISTLELILWKRFIYKNKKSLNLGPKILKQVFLDCNLEKLMMYLELAFSNSSKHKVSCKSKIPYVWDRKCLM